MKKLSYILVFLSFMSTAQEDKKGNVFTNTGDVAKMALAKQKLYAGDHVAALNSFREVEKNNPSDPVVLYYVGLCYYNLGQVDKAKESLTKATTVALNPKNVKPETHFLLGKIYQKEENFDKAIESFTTLKSSSNAEKEALQDGEILMSQCQNAKRMMSSPYDVAITSMGSGINSQFDDKNPCITADGGRMVFTSRRPNGADPAVDKEGDGMYYDDIYIARYDSAKGAYVKPELVGGSVNSKGHDACTSISADGKQIFIYRNDINDKQSYGGEIFVTKMNAGKWKTPEHMGKPISSTYWEGGASVSPDGKTYFFVSERKGGFGRGDIWTVQKISKKEWGDPVNLGAEINTASDEVGIFLAPDGKTLFFCSDNGNSMGSYDVFKTVLENGKWTAPQNLGYPINSPAKEGQISVSTDGRYAYISSERKGGLGGNDIYKVDLKDYAILEKDGKRKSGGLSILKGTIREGGEGFGIPDVDITVKSDSGELIASATTNENGEYFLTLNGGAYTLNVQKKGYQAIVEKIEVVKSEKETAILEKGYLLKK
jgi:tetratricopeptide (TPR) repeat protein